MAYVNIKNHQIDLPDGWYVSDQAEPFIEELMSYKITRGNESERLKNLLTQCYNCDSMKQVKKLIEAEIAREQNE